MYGGRCQAFPVPTIRIVLADRSRRVVASLGTQSILRIRLSSIPLLRFPLFLPFADPAPARHLRGRLLSGRVLVGLCPFGLERVHLAEIGSPRRTGCTCRCCRLPVHPIPYQHSPVSHEPARALGACLSSPCTIRHASYGPEAGLALGGDHRVGRQRAPTDQQLGHHRFCAGYRYLCPACPPLKQEPVRVVPTTACKCSTGFGVVGLLYHPGVRGSSVGPGRTGIHPRRRERIPQFPALVQDLSAASHNRYHPGQPSLRPDQPGSCAAHRFPRCIGRHSPKAAAPRPLARSLGLGHHGWLCFYGHQSQRAGVPDPVLSPGAPVPLALSGSGVPPRRPACRHRQPGLPARSPGALWQCSAGRHHVGVHPSGMASAVSRPVLRPVAQPHPGRSCCGPGGNGRVDLYICRVPPHDSDRDPGNLSHVRGLCVRTSHRALGSVTAARGCTDSVHRGRRPKVNVAGEHAGRL